MHSTICILYRSLASVHVNWNVRTWIGLGMRLTLLWQSSSNFCLCQPETMTTAGCLLYLHRCRTMVLLFHQWISEFQCCFYPGSSRLAIDWVKGDPLWSLLFLHHNSSSLFLLFLPSLSHILRVIFPNQKILTTDLTTLPLPLSPLGFCRCSGSKSWKGLLTIADSLLNFTSIQWKEWVHGW